MKKNLILVILLGAARLQLLAQPQIMIDPLNLIQQLNTSIVIKRSANDYILSGLLPNGSDFGMIARFSPSQMTWSKYFTTTYVPTTTVTSNGDIVVGGENSAKGFVARIDQFGSLLWHISTSAGGESCTGIVEKPSGDIFLVGQRTTQEQFLVKLSSAGTIIWNKHPTSSLGNASNPRIVFKNDSVLLFNDPFTGGGVAGDIELRILDQNCFESLHRTYGIPGNVREMLTSVIEIPGPRYVLATTRPGAMSLIVLDQNFDIVKSRSYTTPGGALENGKLVYDGGYLYLACNRMSAGSQRALVLKLDTASLDPIWNRALSSVNSFPACEPFVDGTLRVPYTRYPTLAGSGRGMVLASLDPATGNFTGTPCESPPTIVVNSGPYTGLVQTDQPPSVWVDLTITPSPTPSFNGYPLLLEDCEPGILPIELLYFVGEAAGVGRVRLSWATGSEEAVDRFGVERSFDGEEWETVAEILPSGSPGTGAVYGVVDNGPKMGQVNYYRLRETNVAGESVTFKVVSVSLGLGDFNLFPNPIRRGEVLRARAPTTLDIFDAFGRPLVRNFRELVVDLPAGNYIVSTTFESGSYQRTMLVVVD